jgi:hypothetical protein
MEIKPEDLHVTTYDPRGESGFMKRMAFGVSILHRPTGIKVSCCEHRSQNINRTKALQMLEEELCYYMSDTEQYHGSIDNVSGGYYVFIRDGRFYWAIDDDWVYKEEEIPQSLYHEFKKHVTKV